MRTHAAAAASTVALAATLFVACGGSSRPASAPTPSTGPPTTSAAPAFRDVAPTAADFVNINAMTRVGDHFVGSLNGNLDAALGVAHNPRGGTYPVGTIIQLIPTEAMVKRRAGYSSTTGDWEFFSLQVSSDGTKIKSSGPAVKNFLGADCAACHDLAEPQFDFVCGKDHGCAPLPLSDDLIARLQQGDPRPRH